MADDYANDTTTTGSLPDGGTVWGTLEHRDDADWFRLALKQDHGYLFTLQAENGNQPILTVWNAQTKMIAYTTQPDTLFTDELVNPFVPFEAGQYYLEIKGGQPGAYRVGMRQAPDDASNEPALARTLTSAAPVAAVFNYAFDHDQFRITAVAGLTYTVSVSADGGNLGNASFLRLTVDGNSSSTVKDAVTTSHSFTATRSGEYLVAAEMASWYPPAAGGLPYHISVSAADRTGPTVVAGTGTVDGAIVVTFDEPVQITGNGSIEIRGGVSTLSWALNDPRVHVSGNTLTLDPVLTGALLPGEYHLGFRNATLRDTHGNAGYVNFFEVIDIEGTAGGGVATQGRYWMPPSGGSASTADAVVYDGVRSDYTIVHGAAGFQIKLGARDLFDLKGFEKVMFTQSNEVVALSLDGDLGQAFRLYTAAFDRAPDQKGLGFWLHAAEHGMSLPEMARGFISSSEFAGLYGARPDDSAFVAALYQNVLHRAGDASGVLYWKDALAKGADRADILAAFSESAENQQQAIELIGNGIVYTPYG